MMEKEQLHTGCLHGAMTLAIFFIGMAVMFGLTKCGSKESPQPIVLTDTIRVTDTLRLREHTKTIEVIRQDWRVPIIRKGKLYIKSKEILITKLGFKEKRQKF